MKKFLVFVVVAVITAPLFAQSYFHLENGNSSAAVYEDANNNNYVGIGTIYPTAPLHISSAFDAANPVWRLTGPNDERTCEFYNVGDGTTPGGSLFIRNQEAAGQYSLGVLSQDLNNLQFGVGGADGSVVMGLGYDNFTTPDAQLDIHKHNSLSYMMRLTDENNLPVFLVDNSGNIGVGASAPLSKVHVADGDLRFENTQSQPTSFPSVIFTTQGQQGLSQIGKIWGKTNFFNSTYLALSCSNTNPDMVITEGGQVGIGTTNPDAIVNIKAKTFSNTHTVEANGMLHFTDPNGASLGYFSNMGTSGNPGGALWIRGPQSWDPALGIINSGVTTASFAVAGNGTTLMGWPLDQHLNIAAQLDIHRYTILPNILRIADENDNNFLTVGNTGKTEIVKELKVGTDGSVSEPFMIGDRFSFHNGGSKYIGYNSKWNGSANARIVNGPASYLAYTVGGDVLVATAPTGTAGTALNEKAHVIVHNDGKVAISAVDAWNVSTTTTGNYGLYVDQGILTEKVKVALKAGDWSDFVFDSCYSLNSIPEIEDFIRLNNHLPDVPSSAEIEKNGLDLGNMDAVLLRKIEELTLHVIELDKQNKNLHQAFTKLTDN